MAKGIVKENGKGNGKGNSKGKWQRGRSTGAFQFARCKQTGASVEGVGVTSFFGVRSSLQGVKKRGGFGRRGRGAFFRWGAFQFARREKTGASVEEVGVPSFIGVRSCLLNIFSFFNKNILNNKKNHKNP